MTDHNATWSEELYYGQDDTPTRGEDVDPRSNDHGKEGYWDYPDDQ